MDVLCDNESKILRDFTRKSHPEIQFEFFKDTLTAIVSKRRMTNEKYLSQEANWGFRIKLGRFFLYNTNFKLTDTVGKIQLNPIFFIAYVEGRELALRSDPFGDGERYQGNGDKGPLEYCGYDGGEVFRLKKKAPFDTLWAYLVGYELGLLEGIKGR